LTRPRSNAEKKIGLKIAMAQKGGTRVAIINVGDDVHYYSTSYEEWMPAKVIGLNEDNSFELDIKSGAHPSMVIKNPTPEDLASKPKSLLVPAYTPPPPREINEDELPPAAKVVIPCYANFVCQALE
jgi:hypothetical protein